MCPFVAYARAAALSLHSSEEFNSNRLGERCTDESALATSGKLRLVFSNNQCRFHAFVPDYNKSYNLSTSSYGESIECSTISITSAMCWCYERHYRAEQINIPFSRTVFELYHEFKVQWRRRMFKRNYIASGGWHRILSFNIRTSVYVSYWRTRKCQLDVVCSKACYTW